MGVNQICTSQNSPPPINPVEISSKKKQPYSSLLFVKLRYTKINSILTKAQPPIALRSGTNWTRKKCMHAQ